MKSVVCVGIATLDRVYRVDQIPRAPAKVRSRDYLEVGGGLAANGAVAIVRLGGIASYWGRIGADAAGDAILEQFRSEHVDVSAVRRIAGARSHAPAVIVDAIGERLIVSNPDPRLDPDPAFLPLERLEKADAVLADVRWPEGSERVLREAGRREMPTVIDAESTSDAALERLCPLARHVIFSADGLRAFTRLDEVGSALVAAHARLGRVVGVTLGAEGVRLRSGRETIVEPAPKVDVVDTTGAGDAFHGAYALAIAEGADLRRAARFATAVASLKCTRLGGRAGLPTRAEVEAFMRGV